MAKSKLPRISPAETEILQWLWQLGEATVQQVCDQLPPRRKIAYATVQTMLRRLEKKGYITHRTEGKAHVFCPAAKREEVVKRSVSDFVNRLFGGDPIPLLHHLAEHGDISADDIDELKRIVEKS